LLKRVDPLKRKLWQHRITTRGDQSDAFRLETRTGEFTVMASLRG
jgi:hypothetical protein